MGSSIVFFDLEVSVQEEKAKDFGAVKENGAVFHGGNGAAFADFLKGTDFLCGHNIVDHDLKYCAHYLETGTFEAIDTLFLSPLLFPSKPYHKLLKDDVLQTGELNNPVNDAQKARDLFFDELNAFSLLPQELRDIYGTLLSSDSHFRGFLLYAQGWSVLTDVSAAVCRQFAGRICENAPVAQMAEKRPVELAYALALISASDRHSITPPWVAKNYPHTETLIRFLRNKPCTEGCAYCAKALDATKRLKEYFGYDSFRKYNDEPLQENAVKAAIAGESLLAVFPTGGGKSLTFQLPALIAGDSSRGLTVVISPLQSLMKDQVDNLEKKGIPDAVTINGMLDPVARAEAIERVSSGLATLLYISPELLRSKTIEKLLLQRNVVRFVIDEAHCFSAWGQDFRVDYMYIGDFIKNYCEIKGFNRSIPVSCFTATAKQKVISDIQDYFKRKLDIDLKLFTTDAARENLHYHVLYKENEDEKYKALRNLIEWKHCPTIVYVSRTQKTKELAYRLTEDGFPAKAFNGKMAGSEKVENQEAFIHDEVGIIVATSAFGMGVDKSDVGLVVHYDISDSLENYVQEAGRAGRDQTLQADCYVLFNEDDLNKHFILLNQTKISLSEIDQVWKAIKNLTKVRSTVCRTPLEIAREAGWNENSVDCETRVKTAIAALENAGFVERGKNVPRVYATGILAHNMEEAAARIEASSRFTQKEKVDAMRIIQSLISARSRSKAGNEDAESRVDYLADILGLKKEEVINAINLMREEGLLADSMDMLANIKKSDSKKGTLFVLQQFCDLEKYLISVLPTEEFAELNLKEINEQAIKEGISGSSVKRLKTIFFFWTISGFIQKHTNENDENRWVIPNFDFSQIKKKIEDRCGVAQEIARHLYSKATDFNAGSKEEATVNFSMMELLEKVRSSLFINGENCSSKDVQEALLYLEKIGAMSLEGGFLVLYNALSLNRLVSDNKRRFKKDDYRQLDNYYQSKMQQIHIVGEFANMMVRDEAEALQFVNEYFQMEYRAFIDKYFKGRDEEINRNITAEKYSKLFDCLSDTQSDIIRDSISPNIAVIAGPGSGKTRVLVHKLASLLLLEDVKSEQLLMLTFSRAAATEFKKRLMELVGNAAHFVEIKTFHSYAFDLLGRIGNLEEADNIVQDAANLIREGQVEAARITKTVLVIDEAQDMDEHEFSLVSALMERNEGMRVIAVGDDDQNIFAFRGSDSRYLEKFISVNGAKRYDMLENYRSDRSVVRFANSFVRTIEGRLKKDDICSHSDEEGLVELIHHVNSNMEIPLADQICGQSPEGTCCVLTQTNEEALRIVALLQHRGIRARLIQGNEEFRFSALAEVQYFLKNIEKDAQSSLVSDKEWKTAVRKLEKQYASSSILPIVRKMLDDFTAVNKCIYRSDFREFVYESKIEDFVQNEAGTILVSTIHKSKGREFDCVYMMLLGKVGFFDEQTKRALYVGFTRAKKELHVHFSGEYLRSFRSDVSSWKEDSIPYPEPPEIALQFSMQDVWLDYFLPRKDEILSLRAGAPLQRNGKILWTELGGRDFNVITLSQKGLAKLNMLEKKGYSFSSAEIGFIVAWKKEGWTEKSAVALPVIRMRKG